MAGKGININDQIPVLSYAEGSNSIFSDPKDSIGKESFGQGYLGYGVLRDV